MREAFPSSGSALAGYGWKLWRSHSLFRNTVFYLSGRFGWILMTIGAPAYQQVLPARLLSVAFLQEMCGKAEDNAVQMDRWFHFQVGANGIARPAVGVSLFWVIAFN